MTKEDLQYCSSADRPWVFLGLLPYECDDEDSLEIAPLFGILVVFV